MSLSKNGFVGYAKVMFFALHLNKTFRTTWSFIPIEVTILIFENNNDSVDGPVVTIGNEKFTVE